MQIRGLFFVFISIIIGCSADEDVTVPRNLQEYININQNLTLDEVIACAASVKNNTSLTSIFYYPVAGATDIRYYETDSINVDETNFTNYKRKTLTKEPIFGGKLERFINSGIEETWGIVTFITEGKLHKSNPIRIKKVIKPTEYIDTVTIDFSTPLQPKFTWEDGTIKESVIYFQVIADEENNFISGTYTTEKNYQYNNTNNVVLDINTENPKVLEAETKYNFIVMGVSIDNWVNLVIEKPFTTPE